MTSTQTQSPVRFTRKEVWTVVGIAGAFILVAIIALWGAPSPFMLLLVPLAILLPVAIIFLAVWLLYKFGVVIVANGVVAAHEELARRGQTPTV